MLLSARVKLRDTQNNGIKNTCMIKIKKPMHDVNKQNFKKAAVYKYICI